MSLSTYIKYPAMVSLLLGTSAYVYSATKVLESDPEHLSNFSSRFSAKTAKSWASDLSQVTSAATVHSKGRKPSSEKMKQALRQTPHHLLKDSGPLPSKVDYTPYAVILDQQDLGSCTSNSTAQCVRVAKSLELTKLEPSFTAAQLQNQVQTLSRLFHYYLERAHDSTPGNDLTAQDSGSDLATSLWVLHNVGAPDEPDWPYNENNYTLKPPAVAYNHASYNKDNGNIGIEDIQPGSSATVTNGKSSLNQGYPLVLGINVYDSFEGDDAANTGVIPMPDTTNENLQGGHAVAVLGYDDNAIFNGLKGYFLCANSWGTSWGATLNGQRGFFYLPYAYVSDPNLTSEIYSISNASYSDINVVSNNNAGSGTNSSSASTLKSITQFQTDIKSLSTVVSSLLQDFQNSSSKAKILQDLANVSKGITQLQQDYSTLNLLTNSQSIKNQNALKAKRRTKPVIKPKRVKASLSALAQKYSRKQRSSVVSKKSALKGLPINKTSNRVVNTKLSRQKALRAKINSLMARQNRNQSQHPNVPQHSKANLKSNTTLKSQLKTDVTGLVTNLNLLKNDYSKGAAKSKINQDLGRLSTNLTQLNSDLSSFKSTVNNKK